MASSPDPIFRNGLEYYRKNAPASVWERVEAGLERKRRKSLWLKVAAGLVLLIATSTVFWQHHQTDTTKTIAKEEPKTIVRESSAVSRELSALNSLQPSPLSAIVERSRNNHSDVVPGNLPVVEQSRNEHLKSSKQLAVSSQQYSVRSKQLVVGSQQSAFSRESSVVSREVAHLPNETQLISMVETDELPAKPASDNQFENSMEDSVNEVVVAQKRTSFSYSSEEVNEKFLKKELPAKATPEKKNASGLQKVIDKALELTNEGMVYSEFREKKNEWLSFNKLSNKAEANK